MRKIKEVLRLKSEGFLSDRQIARSCSIARSTVCDYLERACRAGLKWPLPEQLDDAALEQMLYPPACCMPPSKRELPSFEDIHRELKRKGVTLQLLWYEYKQAHPAGLQYSQFCHRYRQWAQRLDVSLRQTYRAGEKLFVDYAGQTMKLTDPITGQTRDVYLFIATLGASSYTYVEACLAQDLPSWISSHVRAFQFFGGVPEIIVPDNLKAGVSSPCRYEPDINPTYHDMARHYGTVVIPVRVGRPKDKAKVESAVLIAERWIIAALRNHRFFSLAEVNCSIAEKLTEFNDRKFQKLDTTRRTLFETIDKPALKPLSDFPYEYAEWKKAAVNIDYHIEVEGHYYSVPYQLVRRQVDVRLSANTLEVMHKSRRVAAHQRSFEKGKHTTLAEHMPKSHRQYLEWTPSRIERWAGQNGPHTRDLVSAVMQSRKHPEQGFRSCLGIMRLAKRYSPERLEAACARALAINACNYQSVASILKQGLDRQQLPETLGPDKPVIHYNIRGKAYYHDEEANHA